MTTGNRAFCLLFISKCCVLRERKSTTQTIRWISRLFLVPTPIDRWRWRTIGFESMGRCQRRECRQCMDVVHFACTSSAHAHTTRSNSSKLHILNLFVYYVLVMATPSNHFMNIWRILTKGRSQSHINVLIYMWSDDPKNQSEGLYCVRDRAQMSRNIFSAQVGEADGGKDQRNFGWFFCCL